MDSTKPTNQWVTMKFSCTGLKKVMFKSNMTILIYIGSEIWHTYFPHTLHTGEYQRRESQETQKQLVVRREKP